MIFFYQQHIQRRAQIFFKFLSDKKYWLFVGFFSFCLADLMILSLQPLFLTDSNPRISEFTLSQKTHSLKEYRPIWNFNIFHDGDLPPSLSSSAALVPGNQVPKLSRLPLQLNGTIVYSNPLYSIANITVKNKPTSESYQTHETISSLARITKIEAERVYFLNLNNNSEEYIQLPDMQRAISFDFEKKKIITNTSYRANSFIKKVGNFKYEMSRSDVNKHLRTLPKILREAKVVPHWKQGKMIGFRFKYIKPGSMYEKLGFKESDIITSVAGEKPRSQLEAAKLFQRVKNSSKLDAIINREGKDIAFSWSVNEDVSIEEPPKSKFY